MRDMFNNLLVSSPNGGGLFLLHDGKMHKLDSLDTTGFDIRAGRVVRAMQPATLVLFDSVANELDDRLANIDDLHDTYLDGDSCFVVSTHGNEIVRLDSRGQEEHRWTFPGEVDAWHINCITRWNGRVVFSAFADCMQHRGYKEPPYDIGFVQDLETGDRLIAGLFQPHSLVPNGRELLLANSGAFEIHLYDVAGKLLRRRRFDGYTRGIARQGDVIYVGLSRSRNADTEAMPSAALLALDAATWEELGRIRLPVNEIYSVVSIGDADIVATLAKVGSHANARSTRILVGLEQKLTGVEKVREDLAAQLDAMTRDRDERVRDSDRRVFGLLETIQGKDVQIQNRDQIIRDKDAEIQRRDDLIGKKDTEIVRREDVLIEQETRVGDLANQIREGAAQLVELTRSLAAANNQLATAAGEIAARDIAVAALKATISWRITRPLRGVRRLGARLAHRRAAAMPVRLINKLRHVLGTLCRALYDPELRLRYLTLAQVLGPLAAARHALTSLVGSSWSARRPIPVPVFDVRADMGRRAVVLTTPHCDFIAQSIRHALGKIGVDATILYAPPEQGYEDLPHFVICPQMFERLPELYVAFQMEQSVSTRWFTDAYIKVLENSFAILDYSVANIDALADKGLHRKQFFYLPLGYLPDYGRSTTPQEEIYDVVFYGDINNDRRRKFVASLEEVCRVKVINDLFGNDLRTELAKAKVIVNIHYYEGALLETTRLWECVSLGKLVVSERAVNMDENRDLESLVDFVDLDDIDGLAGKVRYWLDHANARYARIKANCKLAAAQTNRFDYFFYRFLLAHDNITFFRFWKLVGRRLSLTGDRLCLNLPEWTSRRRSFDKDNHYGFEVFPGLRHREGWVGCGMSYKLMIMLARKQHMRQISICEDDVEFREGFSENYDAVIVELSKTRDSWDVFSGFFGDMHTDARVLQVRELHGRKLALTNMLISTVFNVYNRTAFDRIELWDERDRDVARNTIDRYLERSRLAVLVCHPFLVGHKAELHSTLWGVSNGEMGAMIQRSEQLLEGKVTEFVAKTKKA